MRVNLAEILMTKFTNRKRTIKERWKRRKKY